ncbi:MAG TPA: SpoIIE family protein phosphatase, partial [Candidatus Lustribacter sp.]|nr:SpoIIE family protein phosphatase [Candidatus Lustribacter sp.]
MTLRQKLFLLLVSIALVPLAVLAGLGFRSSQNVAARLAAENQNAVVADITQLLARNVQANSSYLNGEAAIVELSLQLQAAAVERALGEPAPHVPLYFAERFDGPRTQWPPQTSLVRLGEAPQPMAVSASVGSVMVPRGVDRVAAHDNLERLASIDGTLRALDRENPGLFLAQFTALASGERNNFPGHGNYPPGYDSRQRSWYSAAHASDRRLWTPPLFSASTKQLTFIAAMPVHGPDGRFAGVSAVEIPIVDVLRKLDRSVQRQERAGATSIGRLADEVATILVVPFATEGARMPNALRVIAQRSYQQQAANWAATPALETIDGGNPSIYDGLVDDVVAGRSATVRMTYDGADSLWAISPVPALGAAILIVLPYDRILAAADAASEDVRASANGQLRNSAIVALLVLAALALIAYYVSDLATKPIRELAQVAARIGAGDLNARATVAGHDEITALANAFNAMVPQLQAGLRMQHGLEIARAVQQNLLPLQPPVIPGFDIAGASEYCDETGGDYYDFVDLSRTGEGRVAIAVGDVSGHGIGAALLMASVRAALRASIDGADSPEASMQRANRLLCADVGDGSFMTLVLTLVDRSAGTIRWVNAAHDAPLVYHRNANAFLETAGADVPIGIDPTWPYAEHELTLPAGDFVLAIGTDGIWETEDGAGRPY